MNHYLENVFRSRAADVLAPIAFGIAQPLQYINKWIIIFIFLALIPLLPYFETSLATCNDVLISAVFALSFNILLGTGRMLSFCHAMFFAFGGVVTIHLLNFMESGEFIKVPILFLPLAGGLIAMLAGMLVALIATFRGGFAFSMISLGIGELLGAFALLFSSIFGGEDGLTGDRTVGAPVFGYDFASDIQVYYMIAGWFLVSAWLMHRFRQSSLGVAARAVGENDERAMFIGYDPRYIRYWTFVASTFFAGIAGSLGSVLYENVSSANFSAQASAVVLLKTFLGGVPFFWGPVVGSIGFAFLNKLSHFSEIWPLYQGLLFIAFVVLFPYGITGLILIHLKFILTWTMHCLIRPYILHATSFAAALLGLVGVAETWNFLKTRTDDAAALRLLFIDWDPLSLITWGIFASLFVFGSVGAYWTRKSLKKYIDVVSEQEGF